MHIFACETSLGSFAGVFWYVFAQGFYHGLFLGDIFRELFRMDDLQGVFCGGFFRAISCEAVSPGIRWQRRHLWAHPPEPFLRASLRNHFLDALSQGSLRCAFEQGVSNRFFYRCNLRAKFRIVGFHRPLGRFVFRALSRGKLFGAFFLGPAAFIFSHGWFQWALSLGLLPCTFL